jgi:hypothetical protein
MRFHVVPRLSAVAVLSCPLFLHPWAAGADAPDAALDQALRALDAGPAPAGGGDALPAVRAGGATVRLLDISLDVCLAAGGSTATDAQLGELQGGDHDPKRRGYTFQQAELALAGAVDPYFTGQAQIVYKSDGVELEEAYALTSALPFGLQVKAGKFFTEFGRTNPQHPHQWPWLDQPVINTRIFGGDGTRGVGARVGWLTPLPWFSELLIGMQDPDDDSMVSFLGGEAPASGPPSTIGGRPVVERPTRSLADFLYSARWVNSWEAGERTMVQIGMSGAAGPNRTGLDARTLVAGADLLVKWRAAGTSIPSMVFQSEVIARRFHAAAGIDPGDPATAADDQDIPDATLVDWGMATQLLIGVHPGWACGLRYEYATGSGDSWALGDGLPGAPLARRDDPLRDSRQRLAPLITWNPTEFSKLRLEYDHDRASHLPSGHAESVWLGLEILIGTHPAHAY